jgi:signal transduction histidine kinase
LSTIGGDVRAAQPSIRDVGGGGLPRPGLARAVVSAGLCACGLIIFLERGASFPLERWLVVTACCCVAEQAEVEIAPRLWISPQLAFVVFGLAYLGPAGLFAMSAITDLVNLQNRHRRPFAIALNVFANGAPVLLGAVAMRWVERYVGPHDVAFYVALTVAACLVEAAQFRVLGWTRALRYGETVWPTTVARRFVGMLAFLVALSLFSVRVYVDSPWIGIGILVVAAASSVYTTRLVRDANVRAADNAELAAARGSLLAELLTAEDRERAHLAEVLHDEAIQSLLAARQDIAEADEGRAGRLERAAQTIEQAVTELRSAIRETHPTVLERAGLEGALSAVIDRYARRGTEWSLVVSPEPLDADNRVLFSLARELIANAARHSGASHVEVRVAAGASDVVLSVADDGVGFRHSAVAPDKPGHLGLRSVSERARAAGGRLAIEANAEGGTIATVVIPR